MIVSKCNFQSFSFNALILLAFVNCFSPFSNQSAYSAFMLALKGAFQMVYLWSLQSLRTIFARGRFELACLSQSFESRCSFSQQLSLYLMIEELLDPRAKQLHRRVARFQTNWKFVQLERPGALSLKSRSLTSKTARVSIKCSDSNAVKTKGWIVNHEIRKRC